MDTGITVDAGIPGYLCIIMSYIFIPSFIHNYTAYMKSALNFQFSDKGANLLPAEKQAYINFVDFLDECEGNIINPRRACAGGLRYLSCVCVYVRLCVCVLPLYRQHPSFLR